MRNREKSDFYNLLFILKYLFFLNKEKENVKWNQTNEYKATLNALDDHIVYICSLGTKE